MKENLAHGSNKVNRLSSSPLKPSIDTGEFPSRGRSLTNRQLLLKQREAMSRSRSPISRTTTPTRNRKSDAFGNVPSPVGDYIHGRVNKVATHRRVSLVHNQKQESNLMMPFAALSLVNSGSYTEKSDDGTSTPLSLDSPTPRSIADEEDDLIVVCPELEIPADTSSATMKGWVTMKLTQKRNTSWRNRYIVLVNNMLFVYVNENARKPIATALIDQSLVTKCSDNAFKIETRAGRSMFFQSIDETNTNLWINALNNSKYEAILKDHPQQDTSEEMCQYCIIL